ncbi:MAG: MFS transporter [Alphaproteobacteria bacterium]|nr:MFS transporter [Alphaproteobacteria bacterium]
MPIDVTSAVPAAPARSLRNDIRVISLVSIAHLISHFNIMLLPPLLPLIKADLGVTYEALGFAVTILNLVNLATQTPIGFLVDRLGARNLLIAGLLVGGIATAAVGLVQSYWLFMLMFGILGLSNSVYHPADYSILSGTVAPQRMGRAFAAHNFMGYVGFALGPPVMLTASALWGWRGAFAFAGLFSIAVGLLLVLQGGALRADRLAASGAASGAAKPAEPVNGTRVLTSTPVLLALLFYVFLALGTQGVNAFLVVALQMMYGTPIEYGSAALSGFLGAAALGVAAGGILADRTRHHDRVAAAGLFTTILMVLTVANVDLGNILLVVVMSVAGMLFGAINPSRDMLVRSITPPGQSGKVFAFVTTGFTIGGIIVPPIFGRIIDHGDPHWIFWISAAALVCAIVARPRRRSSADA